ncbi:MAG TPA: DUF6678 family protein [Planctomycetaceae bacterium]|jgi:hypothetical protein
MDGKLPSAKSARTPGEREQVQRVVADRGLGGLANDTKWDELITAIRGRDAWRPSYRFKCVDGPPSPWDVEWFYHLPFPMISVEWFDIAYLQEVREHRLPPRIHVVDHSAWIEVLLAEIGLDYRKGATTIRIFGYFPRSLELFDL